MTGPTLYDVPVSVAVLVGFAAYGSFVVGIVLFMVRMRDQVRDEARKEGETARRLAREAREMVAALETKVAREYVSHEQLARLGDEIKTEIRDLRTTLMTAITARRPPDM